MPLRDRSRRAAPALAALAAFCAALAAAPAAAPAQQPPAMPVGVDAVRLEPLAETAPAIGRFVAPESGVVATRIAERVVETVVRVGDRVEKGAVLARLAADRLESLRLLREAELRQAEAGIARARAELAKAEGALRRVAALRGSTAHRQDREDDAGRDLDIARAALARAEGEAIRARANLALADTALGDAEIRAPYPGVVVRRHAAPGGYAKAGDPVVTLLNDRAMEIEADIPADRVSGLAPGARVRAALSGGAAFEAEARAVVPEENPRTRTRAVRFRPLIAGDARAIAGNQSVTLHIPVGETRDVVTVHKDAVVTMQGRPMVFVVEDGAAAIRPVRTGRAVGDRFEAVEGLRPGDIAVTRGNERLRPGQPVRPLDGE